MRLLAFFEISITLKDLNILNLTAILELLAQPKFRYVARSGFARTRGFQMFHSMSGAGLASLGAVAATVVIDSLARLVCQLELHRPSRLPLANGRASDRVAAGRYVLDLESHHVAATQLAVDGQVEHGEVARSTLDHQASSDRSDVLWSQWGLRPDQLALVPGRSGWAFEQAGFVVGHGFAPRFTEGEEHARPRLWAERKYVGFQRVAVIGGRSRHTGSVAHDPSATLPAELVAHQQWQK